jgi:predicted anti-sigma-YlaC factor YlaD
VKQWIMKLLGRTPPGGMTCHQVGELLQQYLDDELHDAERARRIHDHLEECRRCGMEAETYERIKSTIAAERPDIPPESIERLRAFGERLARGEEPTGQ